MRLLPHFTHNERVRVSRGGWARRYRASGDASRHLLGQHPRRDRYRGRRHPEFGQHRMRQRLDVGQMEVSKIGRQHRQRDHARGFDPRGEKIGGERYRGLWAELDERSHPGHGRLGISERKAYGQPSHLTPLGHGQIHGESLAATAVERNRRLAWRFVADVT